jgi:hypothetical protein
VREDEGPWPIAMPRATLARLSMHVGDRAAAAEHARAALPVMRRLGASDDEIQLRSLLASCAIADGRLADAQAELDRMDSISVDWTGFNVTTQEMCRAELLLARGDHSGGLALHRDCMARMQELAFPGVVRTGLEPWALFGAAVALTAHAHYAARADEAHGQAMFRRCREDALTVLRSVDVDLDYPIVGLLMFALGTWGLLRRATAADNAVQLLVLADRFAYNRAVPTLMWERIAPAAEEAAAGRIAEYRALYAEGRPADLLTQARRAVERIPG